MIAKTQFLARLGLDVYPVFLPQQTAPWLLTDREAVPTEWTVREEDILDSEWQQWAKVLYQPETKKQQALFLDALARPAKIWKLALDPSATGKVLPIYMQRPQPGESLAVALLLPANTSARVVFVEKAGVAHDAEPADSETLRANITIYAKLADNAELDITYIHPLYEGENSDAYLRTDAFKACLYKADLAKGANFRWTSVNLGDSLVEKGEVYLHEEGASANVGGAAYIQADSEQSYQSHIYCLKPHSQCRIHNHGVVESGGTGTFVSISDIAKGAHCTEAREDNRFMTIGDEAKAFVDPTLLIDEYDVKASHAATVGQVPEDALFYLQSRGLTRNQAARLMTAGFLTPLFARITLPTLRDELLALFYGKMHVDDILGEAEDE